ncbi:Pelargonidin 3-O-(6-caffeoylglucoside) 5-O-(6-O-malonylglucoside) 4'''-malonyltransferase [Morella rubra]|uniref:Pelargonidin 3-O-(6-caffeoylglucoside) 5-O-(6-O-malonylglucoside) 4'''-malonyltransferase n=1 Tax=Morella rubra TaxID=262757 RepID=A0A6A1WBS3_9ROSI|nr:Pelargonidin 3-O-(6-caffeoylglucoside) 5-O-(6-O-malonylglucoside) 4'''-malonyltransferase [Morella rubra]
MAISTLKSRRNLVALKTTQLASGSLLLIQLTAFTCGGVAIAVCPSHELIYASSLCTFLRSWTAATSGLGGGSAP